VHPGVIIGPAAASAALWLGGVWRPAPCLSADAAPSSCPLRLNSSLGSPAPVPSPLPGPRDLPPAPPASTVACALRPWPSTLAPLLSRKLTHALAYHKQVMCSPTFLCTQSCTAPLVRHTTAAAPRGARSPLRQALLHRPWKRLHEFPPSANFVPARVRRLQGHLRR
jgi:hypothetical protein